MKLSWKGWPIRRVIPIRTILPVPADWAIETEDGARTYVEFVGGRRAFVPTEEIEEAT